LLGLRLRQRPACEIVPSRTATPPFTREQWAEIAQSIPIPLDKLSRKMRRAICDALLNFTLISNQQGEVRQREALQKLLTTLKQFKKLRPKLTELQAKLRSEKLTDQIEGLIEEVYAVEPTAHTVQQTALKELERPKSKGGRPRQHDRDDLAIRLTDILTRFTGIPVRLSRTRDPQNPDRFLPSGPHYRFVSTVFKLSGILTKGLEHVIEYAAQLAKNRSG
jgi:hypothetical protein